ncbi:hypothetical protein AURDEDRAFT_159323 [Auricularia subglabra TFB-10046 SS5]|nr:hypothetical protein AURDEDRAFT_159323 [Auricularia subglabra TFB-10046 SS5]
MTSCKMRKISWCPFDNIAYRTPSPGTQTQAPDTPQIVSQLDVVTGFPLPAAPREGSSPRSATPAGEISSLIPSAPENRPMEILIEHPGFQLQMHEPTVRDEVHVFRASLIPLANRNSLSLNLVFGTCPSE